MYHTEEYRGHRVTIRGRTDGKQTAYIDKRLFGYDDTRAMSRSLKRRLSLLEVARRSIDYRIEEAEARKGEAKSGAGRP
jgi:hypothetical protein